MNEASEATSIQLKDNTNKTSFMGLDKAFCIFP